MIKHRIFLLVPGRGIIADNGKGAWQFQLGSFWFVRFSEEYQQKYQTKYGLRFGNREPWFYVEEKK